MTDLFYTVPGLRVVPTGTFSYGLLMRGGCTPTVYLDGMSIMIDENMDINTLISPDNIIGIEIYNGPSETPMQYSNGTSCGAILIWTGARPHTASNRKD